MQKTKLYNIWLNIQASFWFFPALIIFALFCLSFFSLEIDHAFADKTTLYKGQISLDTLLGKFLTVGPEGARAILTTIASSMVTVAGVTFSITIVALTLASSQFGPRLMRNFMQNKSTQFVLGSFSATFVYCLLILRSVQPIDDSFFVPIISVNLALIFAIVNIGVLIFFIHHISISLKAEDIIWSVYAGLYNDIDRIFNNLSINEDDASKTDNDSYKDDVGKQYLVEMSVAANKSGYIQAIDYPSLKALSERYDTVIQLDVKAGDYNVNGARLASVRSKSAPEECIIKEVGEAFILGSQRTPDQDVEYAVLQLVEIALRSLSKGINDPFTAISCVDYLSSLLCELAEKEMPVPYFRDSKGQLRLVIKELTYRAILDSAFNQLRQHSSSSVAVTIRIMEAYIRIANTLKDDKQREALHNHACMLFEEGKDNIKQKQDRTDLEERFEECISILDTPSHPFLGS